MKQKLVFILLQFFTTGIPLYTQGLLQYPVFYIPDSVKQNAHVVVREYNIEYQLLNNDKMIQKVKKVVTVFNKSGESKAFLSVAYDKFRTVSHLEGAIYNAMGKMEKKIREKDFIDQSLVSNNTLFDDVRVKYFQPVMPSFPYTVEFQYTLTFSSHYYLSDWRVFYGYDTGIEQARFSLTFSPENRPHWKVFNVSHSAVEQINAGYSTFTWEVRNIPPRTEEPFLPPAVHYLPTVLVSPRAFSLGGFSGSFDSWKSYGTWLWKLNEGRSSLPESTRKKVLELVRDTRDTVEIVRRIYHYMQSRTRYVSIQIGVGGWQPFPAEVVDKNGYGDCKALVNYTRALLQCAGINSYYTLVNAGDEKDDILPDFPSNNFNHAILCVPLKNDTIWLECTSQTQPFNYLGSFTDDRYVLLITEQGGVPARTPVYGAKDNVYKYTGTVNIQPSGDALADLKLERSGILAEDMFSVQQYNADDQKKMLYKIIELPDFTIASYSLSLSPERIPKAALDHQLKIPAFGTISGQRMFIPLNYLDRYSFIPKNTGHRTSDIFIRHSRTFVDTFNYVIPEGYQLEHYSDSKDLNAPFGAYKSAVQINSDTLIYTRSLILYKGLYPASLYEELCRFFYEVAVADKAQAVLIR